ncbi:MAG: hypothetical protein H7A45_07585 [Verrucomicrobiales bacterium]|nr:hypothetical protein [Verrucomicrobiales bacterium]
MKVKQLLRVGLLAGVGLSLGLAAVGGANDCGVVALRHLAPAFGVSLEVDAWFEGFTAPERGLSLRELQALGVRAGMDLQAIRLGTGQPVPTPSIMHWASGHYVAITGRDGSRLALFEPQFGGQTWIEEDRLQALGSGCYLVHEASCSSEDERLGTLQSESVLGRGYAQCSGYGLDYEQDEDCDNTDDPGNLPLDGDSPAGPGPIACPAPVTCPDWASDRCDTGGMATWRVSEPYIKLWVKDVPLYYTMSSGQRFPFELRWVDENGHRGTNVFSVGKGWECNWRSYIRVESDGSLFWPVPSGGVRHCLPRTNLVGATNVFAPIKPSNGETMTTTGAISSSFTGSAKVAYRSGGTATYTNRFAAGNITEIANYRILDEKGDRFGRKMEFHHEVIYNDDSSPIIRLTEVIDYDGRTNTLEYYTTTNKKHLLKHVTDPYGRQITLEYDSQDRLSVIRDMYGLKSTFDYADGTDRMTKMATPYGETGFTFSATGNIWEPSKRQYIVTLPSGAKELFMYRDDCGDLSTVVPESYADVPVNLLGDVFANDNMDRYNTFVWNASQFAAISDLNNMSTNDFLAARMRHWVRYGNTISRQLLFERSGSPDRTTQGHRRWFAYAHPADYPLVVPTEMAELLAEGGERGRSMTWNDWGMLTAMEAGWYQHTSSNSVYQSITYDAEGRNVLEVWGPDRDASNNLERLHAYGYSDNRMVTYTNALDEVTTWSYDGDYKHPATVTYPSGLVLNNVYNDSGVTEGFLSARYWYDNSTPVATNRYEWANGKVSQVVSPLGLTNLYYWDDLDRLTKVEFPVDSTSIEREYNNWWSGNFPGSTSTNYEYLHLTRQKDRLGNWSYLKYDAGQRVTEVKDGLGNSLIYQYCDCGTLESIRDRAGNYTDFAYDLAGRLTTVTHPGSIQQHLSWNSAGQLTNVSDANGSAAITYNPWGLRESVTNSLGTWWKVDYDHRFRPASVVLASGAQYTNTYDLLGRLLTRTEVNSGGVEKFGYTANLPWLTGYTNQMGTNVTLLSYDALGRLTTERQGGVASGTFTAVRTNSLSYTISSGYQVTLTDGKNQSTTWQLDPQGRPVWKQGPDSENMWTNDFNANGWLTKHWTREKGLVQYTHDAVGNVTNLNYPSSTDLSLAYDADGRLTSLIDAVGTTAFTWHGNGALASENGPWDDDTVTYGLDSAGMLDSLSLLQPNASPWEQSYSYDAGWRLETLTSPAGQFDYGYDGASRLLTSLDLPNGALITNVFDDLGRLSSTSLKNSSGSLLNQHAYLRDDAHRPTKQTFTEGNYLDYGYDALSQLTSATGKETGGSNRAHEQFSYGFDTAGNLSSRVNNGLTQTFSITNVLNQLDSVSRSGTMTVAGLTTPAATSVTVNSQSATLNDDASFAKSGLSLSDGDNTFTATATDALGRNASDSVTVNLPATVAFDYDDNGNLTDAGSLDYGYDDANQLTSIIESGEWKTEFVYDGLGRMRIRKEYDWNGSAWVQTEEHRYVYDRMLVIQERDGANVPQVSYTRGPDLSGSLQGAGGIGGLLARTDHGSGTHAFYHADGMGNVTALLDEDEQVVARYAYDPFGNLQGLSGPLAEANEYRYSSKLWHAASGLYAYGYRFYSPSLQRWVNRDPLGEGAGINLYGFVSNGPTLALDPWGLDEIDDWLELPELDGCTTASAGKEKDMAEGAATFNKCVDTTTTVLLEAATLPLGPPGKGKAVKGTCSTVKKKAPGFFRRIWTRLFGAADEAAECTAQTLKGADDALKRMLNAGQAPDKNGLTVAGRALQKHGDRAGSVFPKSTGNPAARNAQGQKVLGEILQSKNQTIRQNRMGGLDIFDAQTGRGVRFDINGNMLGFLDPRKP